MKISIKRTFNVPKNTVIALHHKVEVELKARPLNLHIGCVEINFVTLIPPKEKASAILHLPVMLANY
jgi:hypothetical protein